MADPKSNAGGARNPHPSPLAEGEGGEKQPVVNALPWRQGTNPALLRGIHPATCSPVEMTLQDAERLLGVNITLHDLSGVFNVPGGSTLLGPNRQSHRRYAVCNLGYCAACQAYCATDPAALSVQTAGLLFSSCWKGFARGGRAADPS